MNIEKLFDDIRHERGFEAEDRVFRIFTEPTTASEIPEWIQGYERANEHDDKKRKIDGWVITDIADIPIQIKSSEKGKKIALEKYPRIPIVVVNSSKTDGTVIKEVIEQIDKERQKVIEQWEAKAA